MQRTEIITRRIKQTFGPEKHNEGLKSETEFSSRTTTNQADFLFRDWKTSSCASSSSWTPGAAAHSQEWFLRKVWSHKAFITMGGGRQANVSEAEWKFPAGLGLFVSKWRKKRS